MKRGTLAVLGVVAVLGIAVLLVFGSYIASKNQMVEKSNGVKSAWSEIDVESQRRADLIPNLVETVKAYAKHEETVFADVANARTALLNAHDPKANQQADGQLTQAVGRLLVLTENYPDLKANQNFLSLQDQLEGSENRIAVARRRYNLALQDYNTYVQQFPNSIWAGMAGFHPNNAYFEASAASRTAPTVKF